MTFPLGKIPYGTFQRHWPKFYITNHFSTISFYKMTLYTSNTEVFVSILIEFVCTQIPLQQNVAAESNSCLDCIILRHHSLYFSKLFPWYFITHKGLSSALCNKLKSEYKQTVLTSSVQILQNYGIIVIINT